MQEVTMIQGVKFFFTWNCLIYFFLLQVTSSFDCSDGCSIHNDYINDGYCDCSSCEDESYWSCDSCPGCPTTCGNYTLCVGNTTFTCDNGCAIAAIYLNDSFCDCNNCEDEPNYNCTTCLGGCPDNDPETTNCGDYRSCYFNSTCDDGCEIDLSSVNDAFGYIKNHTKWNA